MAINPTIGAALIQGAGSLLGGIFGSSAQKSANKTNLQIARETNAQNLAIYNDQKQYNTDMWNAQNRYNTPLAQRQRYEDAGINPYLALGNISSGSAQSSLSAPNAPNMVTPQVQPVTAMAEALQGATTQAANVYASLLTSKANADKTKAETAGILTDNIYKAGMYQAQLKKMDADTKQAFQNVKLGQLSEYFQNQTMDTSISQAKQNLDNSVKQGRLLDVQADLAKFDLDFKNKHAEEQFKAEMAKVYTDIMATQEQVKQGWANVAISKQNADTQARSVAQQVVESAARTAGIRLDNTEHSRAMEFIVGKYKADLQQTQAGTSDVLNRNWRDKAAQHWYDSHSNKQSKDEFGSFWQGFGTVKSFRDLFR